MNRKLYVGCYTKNRRGPGGEGIYTFEFDDQNGTLVQKNVFREVNNPSWIAFAKKHPILYVGEEVPRASAIAAVRICDDHLELINRIQTEESGLCHLAVWPGETFITASCFSSGCVLTASLNEDGSLGEVVDIIRHEGHGPHEKMQKSAHVHSAFLFPDGKKVLVSDLGNDTLTVYELCSEEKRLDRKQCILLEPGEGPRHAAFSPDGRFVTVAVQLGNSFHVFPVTEEGLGARLQKISMVPEDYNEACEGAADVHYSADGKRLFGSNRGHNSIVVMGVWENGSLHNPRWYDCFGDGPRNFSFTADERWIMIANQYPGNVAIACLDETGKIGPKVAEAKIGQAVFVAEEKSD